jgi:hypothetical protein
MGAESKRREDNNTRKVYWHKWGPYVAERQWGTVREDYSADGNAWDYFTFDQSRSRAYRWGEDGIAGICDTHQRLCFAHSFWNGRDPFLKEKQFGLSNSQGNHGEDIKEYFYYVDNVPTHSYMKYLYKYPQGEFPYKKLVEENAKRTQHDREYELLDTGIFNEDRYFDIFIEYAKADPKDIYIYITVHNRGPEKATCHVIPTIWFRNTWVWTSELKKPQIQLEKDTASLLCEVEDASLDPYVVYGDTPQEILFTNNETNMKKVFGKENKSKYVKDGFHEYIVSGKKEAVNPAGVGTKAAFHYILEIEPKASKRVRLRLTTKQEEKNPLAEAEHIYQARVAEADEFYRERIVSHLAEDHQIIERQALSGMLWSKQFYLYPVEQWLTGEKLLCGEHFERRNPRNKDWIHLYNEDILSMPDKWEYPWFAAWDLAFHTIPLCRVDPEFAKKQLKVITREWLMHPNGQLPAYEWNFGDVNPPVQAWACWRVYKIDKKENGKADSYFLESVFQKLLLNFTWWVNREDAEGRNIFKGGFLGLDNISVFNRSEQLPAGGELYQSDATSWMGMFAINMLTIAVELSKTNPAYEDMASKFNQHFLHISRAINEEGGAKPALWNEQEGFYYDILMLPDGSSRQLKVKSLVGLIPLLAVTTLEVEDLQRMKGFSKRLHWFMNHRQDLCSNIASLKVPGVNGRYLLSIVNPDKLKKILKVMLDEKEFLSPYGIRSLAKSHGEKPFILEVGGGHYGVDYEPGESTNKLFGGNSNWRGPVWMPMNILLIEALQKFHHYLGDDFKIECPTGSGVWMNLWEVGQEIGRRLLSIFSEDAQGNRAVFTGKEKFQKDPYFKDYLFFHEYYHGETGEGLGASHQTGWSGLIAKIIHQLGEYKGV